MYILHSCLKLLNLMISCCTPSCKYRMCTSFLLSKTLLILPSVETISHQLYVTRAAIVLTALLLFLCYDHLLLMAISFAAGSLSSFSKGISMICSNASICFNSGFHVIRLFFSVNVPLSRDLKRFTKHSED